MRKQKNKTLWIGKILLVLLMIFSQMYAPIEVLAEEIVNNEEPAITEELDNNEKDLEKTETSTENTETVEEKETPLDNTETTGKKEEQTNVENTEETTNENTETTENGKNDESTPEDTTENKSYTYKVLINDEEVEEYTIDSETKKVTIKQSYDGEIGTYHFSNPNETEELDYTNKLYGKYKKEYKVLSTSEEELDAKTITLNYEGDNSEILDKLGEDVYVGEHTIFVVGETSEITVGEVLEKFNLTELQSQYSARLIARDENGNELEATDKVNQKTVFILTNDEVEDEFSVNIYGDYNDDKILDKEDAKKIVDIILEKKENEEEQPFESILDAGNTIYWTGKWDEVTEIHDKLYNSITNKSEVYRGEEFEVKYFITGFDKDAINGIEGKLLYNKEILELVNIEIEKEYGSINDEGRFAYLLDNFHSEDAIMTIKFKAIKVGEANISIENILASIGGLSAELEETIVTSVTVIEAGKGGDVEESSATTTPQTTTSPAPTPVVRESSSYIRPIAKSSDSKIKYLEIEGYKIEFDPNKYEYSIKVKNNVKSLNLNVVLNDSNATYEVFGNENFKVGENTVKIVVTAEDGSTSTYTINVTREAKEKDEEKEVEEKKSSKTIIIILIILVIIGLIYVIFKDDEEDKK